MRASVAELIKPCAQSLIPMVVTSQRVRVSLVKSLFQLPSLPGLASEKGVLLLDGSLLLLLASTGTYITLTVLQKASKTNYLFNLLHQLTRQHWWDRGEWFEFFKNKHKVNSCQNILVRYTKEPAKFVLRSIVFNALVSLPGVAKNSRCLYDPRLTYNLSDGI